MTEWLCETSAPHLWREPGAEGRLGWLDWLHFGEILKDWLTNAESLLEEFSGVDCQVGYSVWMASQAVSLEDYPAVSAYLDRCAGRPALRAAIG